MKKLKIVYVLMVMVSLLIVFAQCNKDHTGTVRVTCYYLNDDNDTIGPIDSVWVEADTSKISPSYSVDTIVNTSGDTVTVDRINYVNQAVREARGYTSGSDSSIIFQFSQPVLLIFNATDTLYDENDEISTIYKGRAEIQIKDGTEVECPIYLTPYSK